MSSQAIEQLTSEHFKVEIFYDEDPMSPAEWDEVGMFMAFPGKWASYRNRYDHLNHKEAYQDECRHAYYRYGVGINQSYITWTPIRPGFIAEEALEEYDTIYYTTRERAERMHSKNATKENIRACMEGELKNWSDYFQGNVYGYVVTALDGSDLDIMQYDDSCWGIYCGDDDNYIREVAQQALDQCEKTYMEREFDTWRDAA